MAKLFLLVDDDAADSELFCEALKEVDETIICRCVYDGQEALDVLSEAARPDLIFLDINMPVMDDWECLSKLKDHEDYKNIDVIIYSTPSHKRDLEIAVKAGALCFLSKPHDYSTLKKNIEMVVDKLNSGQLETLSLPA